MLLLFLRCSLCSPSFWLEDISQTLMQGFFTMIMLVDLADCPLDFDSLSKLLQAKGQERGLSVHIQRQDIFDAMHKI